jgi:hypothetical protein
VDEVLVVILRRDVEAVLFEDGRAFRVELVDKWTVVSVRSFALLVRSVDITIGLPEEKVEAIRKICLACSSESPDIVRLCISVSGEDFENFDVIGSQPRNCGLAFSIPWIARPSAVHAPDLVYKPVR